CSVGASAAAAGRTADELYREADNALYTAKKHKRGMYVIEEAEGNLRQNDAV
ncbi:MAG TPA: hypothetical protein IAA60_01780, partial [Candidatus Ornithomonoglobus intestinigallinarum]|nr:hypothetical protein [Candidatus Ornithomonoglobus intestinigallinarum]